MNTVSRTRCLDLKMHNLVFGSALMLIMAFASLAATPAYADDDHRRGRGQGHQQRGHEQRDHRYSDGGRHREWRGEDRYFSYRPVYPRPYVYSQPVYVPPPVYYAPRQSPGISLFFPLDLR